MMPITPKGIDLAGENRRIRTVFKEREQAATRNGSRNSNAYERRAILERNELLLRILGERGIDTLRGKKILDLGCGGGSLLRHLFDFGAQPEDCLGIDLLAERLHIAKHLSPNLSLVLGSGAQLPFPDSSFDIAFQSLLFTSVLDPQIKQAIASEIRRTTRKGGLLVWYDFIYNNPRNSKVRGVGRGEIHELFPDCRLQFWRVTLAPPIGRIAIRVSPFLYQALAQLPFLRSHYLCLAEKTG